MPRQSGCSARRVSQGRGFLKLGCNRMAGEASSHLPIATHLPVQVLAFSVDVSSLSGLPADMLASIQVRGGDNFLAFYLNLEQLHLDSSLKFPTHSSPFHIPIQALATSIAANPAFNGGTNTGPVYNGTTDVSAPASVPPGSSSPSSPSPSSASSSSALAIGLGVGLGAAAIAAVAAAMYVFVFRGRLRRGGLGPEKSLDKGGGSSSARKVGPSASSRAIPFTAPVDDCAPFPHGEPLTGDGDNGTPSARSSGGKQLPRSPSGSGGGSPGSLSSAPSRSGKVSPSNVPSSRRTSGLIGTTRDPELAVSGPLPPPAAAATAGSPASRLAFGPPSPPKSPPMMPSPPPPAAAAVVPVSTAHGGASPTPVIPLGGPNVASPTGSPTAVRSPATTAVKWVGGNGNAFSLPGGAGATSFNETNRLAGGNGQDGVASIVSAGSGGGGGTEKLNSGEIGPLAAAPPSAVAASQSPAASAAATRTMAALLHTDSLRRMGADPTAAAAEAAADGSNPAAAAGGKVRLAPMASGIRLATVKPPALPQGTSGSHK